MYLNMCVCCVHVQYVWNKCNEKHVHVLWHAMTSVKLHVHIHVCHSLSVCPFIAPHLYYTSVVTGFLRAGTAALWRWSNPPGRTAGTQKCVSRRPPVSSTAASVHGARWGSPVRRASGSPSPPAPAPHGCSCLNGWRREGECGGRRRGEGWNWKKQNTQWWWESHRVTIQCKDDILLTNCNFIRTWYTAKNSFKSI